MLPLHRMWDDVAQWSQRERERERERESLDSNPKTQGSIPHGWSGQDENQFVSVNLLLTQFNVGFTEVVPTVGGERGGMDYI